MPPVDSARGFELAASTQHVVKIMVGVGVIVLDRQRLLIVGLRRHQRVIESNAGS